MGLVLWVLSPQVASVTILSSSLHSFFAFYLDLSLSVVFSQWWCGDLLYYFYLQTPSILVIHLHSPSNLCFFFQN